MKKTILILCLLTTLLCYSQKKDSLVYFQKNSLMFTNEYVFFKDGSFKHYFKTDDGQIWYGVGKYKDIRRTRVLKFDNTDLNLKNNSLFINYEVNFERILKKCKKGFKSYDFYHTSRKKYVHFIVKT